MNIAKRMVLTVIVLISCAGCDQASKSVAQSLLSETEVWSFWGDTVRLQLAYVDKSVKLNKEFTHP